MDTNSDEFQLLTWQERMDIREAKFQAILEELNKEIAEDILKL